MGWEAELKAVKEAAVEAGARVLERYEQEAAGEVAYKADQSPLTLADWEANACIVKKLRAQFPAYAILSEEEKDDRTRLGKAHCFIVDPLDGTKEFLKRNGQFTVNISLSYEGKSVVGAVYVPVQRLSLIHI